MDFHRYTDAEILKSYDSIESALAAGDYLLVAEHAEENSELSGVAMVLGGFPEKGAELLDAIENLSGLSPLAGVCRAFAAWRSNRPEEAASRLAGLLRDQPDLTIARELLSLVRAETIHVVVTAITRPIFTAASDHSSEARPRYGQFLLRHLGSQVEDIASDYQLGQPLAPALARLPPEEAPTFIYAGTPQWFAPPDLPEINIPKVIWMHDTDRFFYRMPWLYGAFDYPTVSISQEHYEIRQAVGHSGASNLFCDSLCSPAPRASLSTEKDYDLIFTGAVFQTPQTDRATVLAALSALADEFRILLVDGHIAEADYLDLIGRAKFVPVINRYRGCPSPRWRDALMRGTFVLYPQGTAYEKFVPGCFPFRPDHMVEDIATHLRSWDQTSSDSPYNIRRLWPDICRALGPMQTSHEDIFEGNLKLAAFQPLLRAHFRKSGALPQRTPPTTTNSWSWAVPPIDVGMFGSDSIIARVSALAERLLVSDVSDDPVSTNGAAQLQIQLALLKRGAGQEKEALEHYDRAAAVIDRGLERNPDSLLLRWNRAHWRLFFATEREEAEAGFGAIRDNLDGLEFVAAGSELGFAFSSRAQDPVFWEYEYGNLVLRAATKPNGNDASGIAQMLRATVHGYLGLIAAQTGRREAARNEYRAALSHRPDYLNIQRLLIANLMDEVEADPTITPSHDSATLPRDAIDRSGHHPVCLLEWSQRLFSSRDRIFSVADLSAHIDHWYRLRRVIGDSQNVRHFPQTPADFDLVLEMRDAWPDTLSQAVSRSRAEPGSTGTSPISDMLAAQLA